MGLEGEREMVVAWRRNNIVVSTEMGSEDDGLWRGRRRGRWIGGVVAVEEGGDVHGGWRVVVVGGQGRTAGPRSMELRGTTCCCVAQTVSLANLISSTEPYPVYAHVPVRSAIKRLSDHKRLV
jgi:hypothetical protein